MGVLPENLGTLPMTQESEFPALNHERLGPNGWSRAYMHACTLNVVNHAVYRLFPMFADERPINEIFCPKSQCLLGGFAPREISSLRVNIL